MSKNEAYFKVSVGDSEFIVEGSELFVNEARKDILDFLANTPIPATALKELETKNESQTMSLSSNDEPKSEKENFAKAGIYKIDSEGKIRITAKVPGSSKRDVTRNVGLIIAYLNDGKAEAGDIRVQCEKQACLDAGNFANAFDDIENFVKEGTQGSNKWTIELTIDGETNAVKLLRGMVDAKKQG